MSADSPPETSVLFARGVIARLAYWPALRIAVEQGWGGPASAQKRTWLASVLVDEFEAAAGAAPDAEYVEELLLQAVADEFEAVLEDGSAAAVAGDVVRLWAEVGAGEGRLLAEFEERADKLKGTKVEVEEAAGDNSDWEDMSDEEDEEDEGEADEAPQLLKPKEEPEVDADGFITVKGKGKGHR